MPTTPRLLAASAAAVAVFAVVGCGGSPNIPAGPSIQPTVAPTAVPTSDPAPIPTATVALGVEFTLAPGQTSTIDDGRLAVRFVRVTDDGRCPTSSNVLCVWEGDAVVEAVVRVAVGTTGTGGTASGETSVELHTNSQFARTSTVNGYKVTLVGLHPEASTDPIDSDSYRATFRVDTA